MEKIGDKIKKGTSLVNIISTAIRIPGIKVERDSFLREQFKDESTELLQVIVEKGPVDAKYSRSELRKMARKLLNKRTLVSTSASFAAGIPGGYAMAATIPADMMQFYGVALRLAQEISYLYGEGDLWAGDMPDTKKVTNQLILYCGVMLGAAGAAQTVRVLSSSLAKLALKKLPQKALTKTFYYPVVKSIAKAFGAKMTKEVFAKGVAKVVPLIGGVVSGGITLATFPPMGKRLTDTLDEAKFSYDHSDFESDWSDIVEVCENEEKDTATSVDVEIVTEVSETPSVDVETVAEVSKVPSNSGLEKIREAKQMLDEGIISDEEFSEIKAKLMARM